MRFANVPFPEPGAPNIPMINFELAIEQGDELFTSLLTSTDFDEMIELSNRLIAEARELVTSKQSMLNKKETEKPLHKAVEANLETLQVMYTDFKERINKVNSACVKNDFYSAAYNATKVQLMASEIIILFSGKKINYDFNYSSEIKEELKILPMMRKLSNLILSLETFMPLVLVIIVLLNGMETHP